MPVAGLDSDLVAQWLGQMQEYLQPTAGGGDDGFGTTRHLPNEPERLRLAA